MPRTPLAALLALALVSPAVRSADPAEVRRVMAAGENFLKADMPADAVAVLETQVANLDTDPGFLPLLARAYAAELATIEAAPAPDRDRAAHLRRRLAILGGTQPVVALMPDAPPAGDPAARAAAEFRQGRYADAARLFAEAERAGSYLNPDERAAWAYARLKAAADRLNAPGADPAAVAADVADALKLVPNNAKMQEAGAALLATARQRGAGTPAPAANPFNPSVPPAADGWEQVETASFRVKFRGDRAAAEAVAKAAEGRRAEAFAKWSGPPAGGWEPKCEVLLHPTAADYAATGKPAAGTGHAVVRLSGGRATERRIDLRADDARLFDDALPRELTHVVLADLFPDSPPPRWAVEGMAVLAESPEEVSRYHRTLLRCARENQLMPVAAVLAQRDFPDAARLTGFYCESVSLVDYLVRLKGEKTFTIFLRELPRYGAAAALKRQYGLDGPAALEAAWRPTALVSGRAQAP